MDSPVSAHPDLFPAARPHAKVLREMLARREFFIAPGAYDCITARLVETSGFSACYVTGSGVSMSMLGAPDLGLASYAEIRDRITAIAGSIALPVIADIDTGYGGPLNVMRTVADLRNAGVAAVQIEDQDWPKKCGHEPGKRLVDIDEMQGRIAAAIAAGGEAGPVVIARTDAIALEGLDGALDRARAYVAAGAEVIFVEAPPSREALQRIAREIDAPLLANMVEGGKTPILTRDELSELGFAFAIYPNALTRLFARSGLDMLADLRDHGTTDAWRGRMVDHGELWELFRSSDWYDLERRFAAGRSG